MGAQELPRVRTGTPPVVGRLDGDRVKIRFVLTQGRWYPEAEDGPSATIMAIAEEGKPPHNPAPTIRVREGTLVELSLRNTLPVKATVFGFYTHPGRFSDEHFELAASETKVMTFLPGAPGTYLYAVDTEKGNVVDRTDVDSQMNGVIIVEPKSGAAKFDAVLLLSNWFSPGPNPQDPEEGSHEAWAINGKMWPYTERFVFRTGAMQSFLIANATMMVHPMHLHGNYFTVLSENQDGDHDVQVRPDHRFLEVTHPVPSEGLSTISFRLQRPGRWLFHCHMLYHTAPSIAINEDWKTDSHRHMSGLVMGMEAKGKAIGTKEKGTAVRHLRLDIKPREQKYANGRTGIQSSISESGTAWLAPSVRIGPVLDLTRGQPVAIEIHNEFNEPTTVHWHGIELDSFYDGAGEYGGVGSIVTPLIEPGKSFTVQFTPPRSGTFIYHSHYNDVNQVSTGLYGALIVREPGEAPSRNDLVFLLAGDGPEDNAPFLLNGDSHPDKLLLVKGRTYRLRFISMRTAQGRTIRLLKNGQPVQWLRWAKDGSDLPIALRVVVPAEQMLLPGETFDYVFTPDSLELLSLETGRKNPEIKVPVQVVEK